MSFRYFKVDSNTTKADLDKQRRKLAMKNHPDKGGSNTIMSAINDEYDKALKYIKNPLSQENYSKHKQPKHNPFEGFKDFNDFFSNGGFDNFFNAHFGSDYQREKYYHQQWQQREYERKRRQYEEQKRYEEELKKRVYQFKTYIRVSRFRKNGREEVISSLNTHVKKHDCKMFVNNKVEKLKWYQLSHKIEFKVKAKDIGKVRRCLEQLKRKFNISNCEIYYEV